MRPKSNLAYDAVANRLHPGSFIVADETIHLARQPGEKYCKLKQTLRTKHFLAKNPKAIRLQIITALQIQSPSQTNSCSIFPDRSGRWY